MNHTWMNPDTALIVLTVGLLGVYFELCTLRWVLPGVAGGVLAAIGAASLAKTGVHAIHAAMAAATVIPFAAITVFLLATARRARANKRVIEVPPR